MTSFIKEEISSVLRILSDPSLNYFVNIDPSRKILGCVLMQDCKVTSIASY